MRDTIYALLFIFVTACAATAPGTRASPGTGRSSTDAVDALVKGDYAGALAIAERGLIARPKDGWLLYDKGAALAGLGRLEPALDTLRQAEQQLTDPRERSLAAYRRAIALEFAGRCAEASTELARYAALVRKDDPALAADAEAHLTFCVTPSPQEVAERQESEARATGANQKLRQVEELSTDAVRALIAGDYRAALAKAEAGLAIVEDDPWLLYNKGAALAGLAHLDDSLLALRRAERLFAEWNIHGRSISIYRRALALEIAGRCEEESAELKRYAEIAQPQERDFAGHAQLHLKFCKLANAMYYKGVY